MTTRAIGAKTKPTKGIVNSLTVLLPLRRQVYKIMENDANKKHVHVSKYSNILKFSRCKYRWMYLEIPLQTHYNSICEFTIHNIVFENVPNLPWLYPLYKTLIHLSMDSVPRFYSLYHCHVFPLRNLQRQKKNDNKYQSIICIAEPILI